MKADKLREEISAYLDEETGDPEKIAKIVRDDPEAARIYSEMRQLRARLKGLRPPAPHPAFATRVMASVAGATMERPLIRWLRLSLPAVAVAALILCAGVWLAHLSGNSRSQSLQIAAVDPAELAAVIEQRVLGGEEIPVEGLLDDAAVDTATSSDDIIEEGLMDRLQVALDAEEDLDSTVEALNREEAQTLRRFLVEFINVKRG